MKNRIRDGARTKMKMRQSYEQNLATYVHDRVLSTRGAKCWTKCLQGSDELP